MPTALRLRSLLVLLALSLSPSVPALAQMETATLSGVIQDPNGRVVPDVEVAATRIETGTVAATRTNGAGIYFFTGLMPGHYHLTVRKPGFKEIAIKEFQLNVQDKLEQNFSLEIGSVSETVTVSADDLHINTTDATVSTVVDRQFAENLPMNGRSFQTLIQLTPGVVTVPSNGNDGGQFSVNGQRGAANYWMVDGVSANIGVPAIFTQGNGISGALPSFGVQGGTNSLVSVDAMQEFRIQTSTYSPEFGRTPGGQISIVTRSGTNQFHGNLFEYLRNDVLDANDWFADKNSLPKPKERQNDFGGTLGGPIVKDRTFFFFSYEGLRLRLPQVVESLVPDVSARQNASPAAQPFLNAFPLPTPSAPDNVATGVAQFNASFSNNSALDAYSLRVDHKLKDKLTLFGRYNYSPSSLNLRGSFGALSQVVPARITTETATAGATWIISSTVGNDLRLNYSRASGHSQGELDNFGGAVPLASLPFPPPFTGKDGVLLYNINALQSSLNVGPLGQNIQSQINATDNLSVQNGSHSLKFGFDLRRLSPSFDFASYIQQVIFDNVGSAQNGNPSLSFVSSNRRGALLFHNLGVFAQDTWRIRPRLTVTYGLRWDVDFAPSAGNGINLSAVTGFNLNDLSHLALALPGTPPFNTTFGNFAPRVGVAYQISQSQKWQTVLRGGFGVFYDLATSEVGNSLHQGEYPFGALKFVVGGTFPLDPPTAAPPPITPAQLPSSTLLAFDPHLRLPYTLQWNVALEQALGSQQTISASYIGSAGRRLMQSAFVNAPNPNIGSAQLTTNAATSNYNALQLQFQRRLSRGLQALASYTWSHSIDTASAGSVFGNQANALVPSLNPSANRGPSDFDIRHAFSGGVTYNIPAPQGNALAKAFLRGWSLQNIVQARSAPPVDLFDSNFFQLFNSSANVRPDAVPGVPFYLFGPQYAGGRALNRSAFQDPPADSNGNPLRQGNLGRNRLRAFRAAQWDLAVHRDFPIHEALKLQFRAEMFNVLNHPNFGPPVADFSNVTQFGQSVQMLGRSLDNANQGGGSFSPLYQIGGPRSVQFALKLQF